MNSQVKLLIIDDKPSNIKTIRNVLKEHFGFSDANLIPEESLIDDFTSQITFFAKDRRRRELNQYVIGFIEEYDIDLLILDFALTEEEIDKDIKDTSGYSLLDELKTTDNKVLWRLPVVPYTFMRLKDLPDEHRARYVAAIPKSASNKTDLTNTLFTDLKTNDRSIIHSILYHGNVYKETKRAHFDLAILCALKEEFDEVLKLPNIWKDLAAEEKSARHIDEYGWITIEIDSEKFLTTKFKKKDGQELKVVAKCMYEMGMVESATYTTRMIDLFKPTYFAMTGIAAGIKGEDIEFGDILIPQLIWNWQAGKHKTVYQEEYDESTNLYKTELKNYFDKDMRQLRLDKKIKTILNESLLNDENFLQHLLKNYDSSDTVSIIRENEKRNRYPKIIVEKMVSGSAVVANNETLNDIKTRKLVGLDMEAYGVLYAVEKATEYTRTKGLVIKSICDFADSEKSDDYHKFAAYASAQTLFHLFTEYVN